MAGPLPDGTRGRVLAVTLALAAAALVWAGVVYPLVAWHTKYAEHLEQRRALARRMAELTVTLPE